MVANVHTKAARQLNREHERAMGRASRAELRSKDLAELARLRKEIASAKAHRSTRLREVASMCKLQRAARTESAQRRRLALRETIRTERLEDRGTCGAGKERVRDEAAIAVRAAKDERKYVKQKARARANAPRSRAPSRAESDAEVRGNVDRRLWPVWERRKGHTHAGEHASRTEVFLEWVEAHSPVVYEILEAENVRELAKLERQERALAREMAKPSRYQGHATALAHRASQHADEWGAP